MKFLLIKEYEYSDGYEVISIYDTEDDARLVKKYMEAVNGTGVNLTIEPVHENWDLDVAKENKYDWMFTFDLGMGKEFNVNRVRLGMWPSNSQYHKPYTKTEYALVIKDDLANIRLTSHMQPSWNDTNIIVRFDGVIGGDADITTHDQALKFIESFVNDHAKELTEAMEKLFKKAVTQRKLSLDAEIKKLTKLKAAL